MNDDPASTNDAVSSSSFEEMVRFNNGQYYGSSNAVAAIGVKQEYCNSYLKSSQEELGSCYSRKSGQGSHELEAREKNTRGTKRARTSSETQYHIMSERKRRQDIAEKFIALSATIPGLRKIDKASVLREAINYVGQFQQRIAVLEKATNNKSIKPLIISKARLCSASCETIQSNDYYRANEVHPEVEARGLEKEVLIRIYCERRKGIMLKLLALLKDVHLSIASGSVLPLGNSILNIIIIAQMSEKYNLTVNDLVKTLKRDLLNLYEM
ncbi:Transcription factor bHLH25 [Spatholobus suberectus]|nr:Transcription factor bHLH25 [Spatholobus suberectus]